MSTKLAVSSFYLIAMLFFWRFNLEAGGVGLPIYFGLALAVLFFHKMLYVSKNLFLAWVIIGALFPLVLLQGVEFERLPVALIAWTFLIINFQAITFAIRDSQNDNWRALAIFAKAALVLHVGIQLAELLGLQFLNNRVTPSPFLPLGRPSGLSAEPSHVALLLSPLIFSSLWPRGASWGGNISRRWYGLVYFSIFLAPSLTAILVILGALFFRISSRYPIPAAVIGIPMFLTLMDISYVASFFPPEISDRIHTLLYIFQTNNFDRQTNLSAVVFYGAYQAATATLSEFPLGFGLLNMAESYGTGAVEGYFEVAGTSNINDGSSMLLKLIAEFGYLGLGFVVVSIVSYLRFMSRPRPDIMVAVLAFPLFATFARGASYFDAFTLVGVTLFFLGLDNVTSWKRSAK